MTVETYRVLVTGSRDLTARDLVEKQLSVCLARAMHEEKVLVVVQGGCPGGADLFAHEWAGYMLMRGFPVVVEGHPAQNHPTQDFGPWPHCGPRRNNYMVGLGADECLGFIGPCTKRNCARRAPHGSHGASGCAAAARRAGIPVKRWDLWRTV
jgi:hypothetical protein